MKKLFLTSALFLTFAFSYANDNEKKSEVASANPKKIETENIEAATPKALQPASAIECYILSCDIVCFTNPIETEPGCDIECVFEMLELFYCS